MAQISYTVANQTFPSTRSNINSIFAALKSSNSGATAPTDKSQGTLWLDTTDDILKIRNVADGAWEDIKKMGTQLPAAITSNTTLTSLSNLRTIRIDATSGNVTVTLPAASDGYSVDIVRVDNTLSVVTIQRAGSDLINGATTATLNAQWQALSLRGATSGVWLAVFYVTYLRGTWLPGFTGSSGTPTISYTTQAGEYLKLGNLVHLEGRIDVNTISGGSGSAKISGLPFPVSSAFPSVGAVNVVKASSWITAAPASGYAETSTLLDLTYYSSATNLTEIPLSHIGSGTTLFFAAGYITNY